MIINRISTCYFNIWIVKQTFLVNNSHLLKLGNIKKLQKETMETKLLDDLITTGKQAIKWGALLPKKVTC